ncbi:hypothetical protein IAF46_00770, partial [Acinetobacter baumannii]|nr:hypothetical protein [Acinetobacter baumannii]
DDDLTWENRLFREHSFFANNRFNYGIYTGGYYNDNDLLVGLRKNLLLHEPYILNQILRSKGQKAADM